MNKGPDIKTNSLFSNERIETLWLNSSNAIEGLTPFTFDVNIPDHLCGNLLFLLHRRNALTPCGMNTMKPQSDERWLVLSYYANVNGRAASYHIDDRLDYFHKANINATLLSSILGPRHSRVKHIRIFSIGPRALLEELKFCIKRNTDKPNPLAFLKILLASIAVLPAILLAPLESLCNKDKRWSWQFSAFARGMVWALYNRPDRILTTGGSASAHVAGLWISKILLIPLACEFQDPLVYQYPESKPELHFYHKKLEVTLEQYATHLIYLTDGATDAAKARLQSTKPAVNLSGGNTMTVKKPAESASTSDSPAPYKPGVTNGPVIRVAHLGTLSDIRNLEHLFKGIEALAIRNPTLANNITLNLAGSCDKQVVHSIETFTLSNNVNRFGKISREEAHSILEKADIALLIQGYGPISRETIPSKTFEYLQSGKPILALVDDNNQLATMLKEHNHSVIRYTDSIESVADTIESLLSKPLPEPLPSNLTVEASVHKLVSLIFNR